MNKLPILAVVTPCMDTVKTHFCFDLVNLFDNLHRHEIVDPRFIMHQTSILPLSRCILVREALKIPAEWLLFLDSDMRFPNDIVHRLMAHRQEVVACQYAKKNGLHEPVIRYDAPEDMKQGLVQVQSVATGCLLIKASVFERLPKPWFAFVSADVPLEPDNPDSMCLGEDVYFSRLCNAADIPLYCDFEASRYIGHVGQATFKIDSIKFGNQT